ncbi:hypothetical protein IMX26_04310 [Clostridium sp. 'deep sea']|uniref:hypothetical protein n=1 Tax=Clostridium sp. 'deep sea' TaxID=2779445 RepID=UPI00189652CA|nr:hypothetical protein [Clostridium sp. 'deep sea']QOR36044.1 hypothetical protein IMX26_04310 [Clostridium sp. 'deep sea']
MIIRFNTLLSKIHNSDSINKALHDFNCSLEAEAHKRGIKFVGEEYKGPIDLEVWYVKSGGVENYFEEKFDSSNKHYILLTTDKHNSLPASLEIHSFITQQGCTAEILHGSPSKIVERISKIAKVKKTIKELKNTRIGVIGKPSDWLIASDVNYISIKEQLGIELIDINLDEFYSIWKDIDEGFVRTEYSSHQAILNYNQQEVSRANTAYKVLKILINKYNLQALTIRCFDLVEKDYGTGCLALSFLNSENIISGCEGDITGVISMVILNKLSGQPVFMANPSRINQESNEVLMAHCTLPWNMATDIKLDTHFETGQGIGVKGEIPIGDATVFRMSNAAENYFVSSAQILANNNDESLCRTQITMKLNESVNYFLNHPYGNHHLICNGDYTDLVNLFFELK